MLKVYGYKGCSTCRAALKWLSENKVQFESVAIRETPPTVQELRQALDSKDGALRTLFNSSGMEYRALDLKTKLLEMSNAEAIKLLSENGNLVKRPFAVDENSAIFLVGFKEPEWRVLLD